MRSTLTFIGIILVIGLFGSWARTTGAAPPADAAKNPAYEPETMRDPYMPGEGQRANGLRTPRAAPPGSVQVNVDALGNNIVGDAANEPSIAIDPTNPQRMAVGWRQFDTIASNFRQAGRAYTTDGGATWTFPGVLTPGTFRSDPVLAADTAGRFFYNSLLNNFCMDVWQSANAGATWPTSVAAFGGDKNWIAIDNTVGIGAGHIYGVWQSAAVCPTNPTGTRLFTRSTDHGNSWMSPIAITNNPKFGVDAVGPDGAVYVAGVNSSNLFVVAKSSNAQNSAVTPTWDFSVTGNFLGGTQAFGGPNPAGLLGQVWIATHPTDPTHIYLLCSVDPTGTDPLDVRFARSTNGGQTWGASVRVNDDSTTNGAYQWFGTMSVAPNGRIDVIWNDTRDDPGNSMTRLYYSYSTDEGATWSPNIAKTPAWNPSVGWPQQNKIGDYYQSISDNNYVHVIYAATFNGEQDLYYTRIAPNDCDGNGVSNECQINCNLPGCNVPGCGQSNDCNGNGIPDGCENDCQPDGIADSCQLVNNDCNANGVPDDCEPGHEDCNNNGTFDLCEAFVDCNGNGHLDACDITSGFSGDCNGNLVPDECEIPSGAGAADVCANALFITPGFVYDGRTSAATTTDAGSGASCGASGRDVYYRYRPMTSGTLNLSLCSGTIFDTVLSFHTGCPGTTANQIAGACDDDGCGPGGGPSRINNITVTAGTTYLIRVAGFNNAGGGGDVGAFNLTLTGPAGVGDCDNNSVPDTCEIAAGGDANGDGIPDICQPFPVCSTCFGDMNGDNIVDSRDITAFAGCFLVFPTVPANCGCADMNANHQVREPDVSLFVDKLLVGGCP